MKPRIRLCNTGNWMCRDDIVEMYGKTPRQAYLKWLGFSLRYAFKKRTAKPLRRKQDAAPIKHGPSIDVARVHKAAPIELPPYSEALVRQVPGTLQRPAYVPPPELRMRAARAAGVQPPLVSVSGAGPAGRSLGGREADE